MPLLKGSSKKVASQNISEFHTGKTYAHTLRKFGSKKANDQAVAVALSTARKYARKAEGGGDLEDPRMKAIGIRPVEGTPDGIPSLQMMSAPVAPPISDAPPDYQPIPAEPQPAASEDDITKAYLKSLTGTETPASIGKIVSGSVHGLIDQVKAPGEMMKGPEQVQHATPGMETEEESFLQNLNNQNYDRQMTDFGAGMATNILGASKFFGTPENAVGIGGGKLTQPTFNHPKPDDFGSPVPIKNPTWPTLSETWVDPQQTATFVAGQKTLPNTLNGTPFEKWTPPQDWVEYFKQNPVHVPGEPEFHPHDTKATSSGTVILEPDGRVWLTIPTNKFGGYEASFPKGHIEEPISLAENAIKETFEETGLKVKILGHLADVDKSTTRNRYYLATREGGTPSDMGWETQGVHLANIHDVGKYLNKPTDMELIDALKKFASEHNQPKPAQEAPQPQTTKNVPHSNGKYFGQYWHPYDLDPKEVKQAKLKSKDPTKGSNPGGVYEMPDGTPVYIKQAEGDHAIERIYNEKLANELLHLTGVPVTDVRMTQFKGKPSIASYMVPGEELKEVWPENYDSLKGLREHYPAHLWLQNYDFIGNGGNMMVMPNGQTVHIDPGGAMRFRAQGKKKGPDMWGPNVEHFKMFPGTKTTAVLGEHLDSPIMQDSAKRVAAVTDQQIHDLVQQYGPLQKGEKAKLEEVLKARRDGVAKMYGVQAEKKSPTFDPKAKAKELYEGYGGEIDDIAEHLFVYHQTYGHQYADKIGERLPMSVRMEVGDRLDELVAEAEQLRDHPKAPQKNPEPFGASSQEFGIAGSAFPGDHPAWDQFHEWHHKLAQEPINLTLAQKASVGYWGTAEGYKEINGYLRGHEEGTPSAKMAIQYLGQAMAGHPLKENASVWRGLHGPQAAILKNLKPGDTFYNKGFTATTVDPRQSTHYAAKDENPIILNYHLPAGHPSLYVSHPEAGNYIQSERELLLPSSNQYKILKTEKIKAPLWHYLGNLVDSTPREYTVYHVEPTTGDLAHATQLDTGKSMPEPFSEKMAAKAREEKAGPNPGDDVDMFGNASHADKAMEDADWKAFMDEMESQAAGPEWTPPPGRGPEPVSPELGEWIAKHNYGPLVDAIEQNIKFKDIKDVKLPPGADPLHKSIVENREKIEWAGGNPDIQIVKGGDKGYPPELPDMAKKYENHPFKKEAKTGAWYGSYEKDVSIPYGQHYITHWVPLPRQKVIEMDFNDMLTDAGHVHPGEMADSRIKFRPTIKYIRGKYDPEILILHNVLDQSDSLGSKHATQVLVFKTNVLRAPDARMDADKWHTRETMSGLAGLGVVGAWSYSNKDKDEKMARGGKVKFKPFSSIGDLTGLDEGYRHKPYKKTVGAGKKALRTAKKYAEGGAAGNDYNTALLPEDEARFQIWKQQNMPNDSGADYDQRGAYMAQFQQQANGHWQDQFKKPNHPTFSDQSQYAVGDQRDRAGSWSGDQFIPPANKKRGGKVADPEPKPHEFINFAKGGMINSNIPGRTDKIPMKVATGAYVLPADIPSALGQGNTVAGKSILDMMFNSGPYGLPLAKGRSQRFQMPHLPSLHGKVKGFADGGETDETPIVAAGGEYIVNPDEVIRQGNGSMKAGHKVLDAFVLHTRKEHIKTLQNLKGPK